MPGEPGGAQQYQPSESTANRLRRRPRPCEAEVVPDVQQGPRPGCPKRMQHGPCGGVRHDGACEMADAPCVFLAPDDWPAAPSVVTATPVRVPLVLTDLSTPPGDAATLAQVVGLLAPTCDAVLVGDHQDRADHPPSTLARLVTAAGPPSSASCGLSRSTGSRPSCA